jgi:hypothetical protein
MGSLYNIKHTPVDHPLKWSPHPIYPIYNPIRDLPPKMIDGVEKYFCKHTEGWPHPVIIDDKNRWLSVQDILFYWEKRETQIANEKNDPLRYIYKNPQWEDAERLLKSDDVLIVVGGNRSSKTKFSSYYGSKEIVEWDDRIILLLSNNETTSVSIQQKNLWEFLPPEWKAVKHKRGRFDTGNISYDPKNGFSKNKIVTPRLTEVYFGSYEQDLNKFEGMEFDLIICDENLPLQWFENLRRGLATRGGKMIWTFTPIHGLTPAVAAATQGAVTIQSRPVNDPRILDPNKVGCPDCPPGHMPYIRRSKFPIIHFWSIDNKFSPYENMVKHYGNEVHEKKMIRFFGYCNKVNKSQFGTFCQHHILKKQEMEKALQKRVARHMIMDPASGRNPFIFWVAIDEDGRHFIYREWPDVPTHGAWATHSTKENIWDGDRGPAQDSLSLSIVELKKLILKLENGEKIWERRIDPRSGGSRHISEKSGGMSLIESYEEENKNPKTGEVIAPSMEFIPAPGFAETVGIEGNSEGIQGINNLLYFDITQPIVPYVNEPMLYISEECENIIWALQNYTGNDGPKSACKDPIDGLRYMATSNLQYYDEKSFLWTKPRGLGSKSMSPQKYY